MTKTAEVVNALFENFDYDKFVKEHKDDMNKKYRVPLGGMWIMGDTSLTNAKFIQKRAAWVKKDNNPMWKSDIICLINRISNGLTPKATDLTEEKRQKLAAQDFGF